MSFLPDDLIIDDTVDTHNMRPEDDFASPADPRIPRRAPLEATEDSGGDSYYGAQPRQQFQYGQPQRHNMPHRDLSADAFNQQGNLPQTFTQGQYEDYPTQREEIQYVDSIPDPEPAMQAEDAEDHADAEEFSDELLNAAGLTREVAERDFGTVDALSAAVRMYDTRMVSDGAQSFMRQPAKQQEDIVVEPDQFEMPEASENWDDDTKQIVSAMGQQFQGMLAKRDEQIKAQMEILQQQKEEAQRERAQRELEQFDMMINSLPDEYVPILGSGRAFDLEPNSMHFNNRVHLERTMGQLQEGNRLQGRPPIGQDELMIRALAVAFPETQRQEIRNQVVEQVSQRQQMMTQRPTQRQRPAMSRTEKAGQTAEDWYRKHNMSHDQMDEYEF